MVGRLIYITLTRPDISSFVSAISQFMAAPKQHMVAIKGVCGLSFSSKTDSFLTCYPDAYWANDFDDRRSINGFMLLVGETPITWK
eukprot:c14001_g1_i2 orf=215-472(-)